MTPVAKRYSLFQRTVRVVQTSIRRGDRWAAENVPGLPNPPEMEEKFRANCFVDLWELSIADHRRIFSEVWQEYKASFTGPTDEEIEQTKELKQVAEGVDTEAVLSHAEKVVQETRSQDDVATTLKKNVDELRDLAKVGRDAALKLEKKDVDTFKTGAQSWLADKLLVGQSVLMSFIEGYREGKNMEMEREDALLITFAKQAAEDHKDILQNQIKKIMDEQREKQRQEQTKAAAAEKAEGAEPTAVDKEDATDATEEAPALPTEETPSAKSATTDATTPEDKSKQR
ncbi:hypothetical protein BBJ29_003492 [Phytophthora kernoviae]|uniref:Uncharacterized protein n=2 Tax=Phytophthora kernoviae TaxID=325452 RepID=A0A3R7GF53_9STRA|nr:hypothetical protein BBJ29_003492 [Phytophthora kernoviae]